VTEMPRISRKRNRVEGLLRVSYWGTKLGNDRELYEPFSSAVDPCVADVADPVP